MNRYRTKFTWFIGYEQFRCHSYLESCKAYYAENRIFGQTRSPGDSTPVFYMRYEFKGEGRAHRENVAIMLHRRRKNATPVHRWVSQLQLREFMVDFRIT